MRLSPVNERITKARFKLQGTQEKGKKTQCGENTVRG